MYLNRLIEIKMNLNAYCLNDSGVEKAAFIVYLFGQDVSRSQMYQVAKCRITSIAWKYNGNWFFLLTHFFIHISYVGSNCPFIYEVEETKSHRCLIKSNDEKNWGGGGSKKKKNDKEHNMQNNIDCINENLLTMEDPIGRDLFSISCAINK